MSITKKKPAVKLTVGAQYICFNTMDSENDWTTTFETEVVKLPTVVNASVTDNTDAYDSYASGQIYDTDTAVTSKSIAVTNLAFPEALLARMRGDDVDGGVVLGGGRKAVRPYFAYGMVVEKKDGSLDLRWYPKAKLTDNDDVSNTSTDTHQDQNYSVTIKAFSFDDDEHVEVRALTSETGYEGITEDAFFAAPLLTAAAVKALIPVTPPAETQGSGEQTGQTGTP